jgi:hypothetical protein
MATKKNIPAPVALPVMADPFLTIRADVISVGKAEKDLAALARNYNDRVVAVRRWLIEGQMTVDNLEGGTMKARFMDAMAEGRLSAAELKVYRSDVKQSKQGEGKAKHDLHGLVHRAFSSLVKRLRDFDAAVNADPNGEVVWGPTGKPVAAVVAAASSGKRATVALHESIQRVLNEQIKRVNTDLARGKEKNVLRGHAEIVAALSRAHDLLNPSK